MINTKAKSGSVWLFEANFLYIADKDETDKQPESEGEGETVRRNEEKAEILFRILREFEYIPN